MRIHLIDDHPVFSNGFAGLTQSAFPDASLSFGSHVDLEGLKQDDITQSIDLLILDLMLPGFDPLRDFSALRRMLPRTAILVVSMTDQKDLVQHVMSQGANGFVHKSTDPRSITQALIKVMDGDILTIFPETLTSRIVQECAVALTGRQREVLSLLAQGMSNKEIGRSLGISHHTVRLHVSTILHEIGVSSRSAAADRARDILSTEHT